MLRIIQTATWFWDNKQNSYRLYELEVIAVGIACNGKCQNTDTDRLLL